MSWHVTTDPEGEPTLWHGDTAVLRRHDLTVATWGVRTPGDRREYEALLDRIWALLTAVLAPDEATVERLGRTVAEYDGHNWDTAHPDEQDAYVEHVNVTLAALAGIRETDTEAVSGNG